SKPPIFRDEGKLSIDYVPDYLPHRERELRILASYFRFMIDKPGSFCQKVLIIGPVGTGKTATSKLFGRVFTNIARRRGITISYVHVNCHKDRSLFMVLSRIIKQLNPNFPGRGLSAQELLHIVWDFLDNEDRFALIALDEVDYFVRVAGEDSIYDLIRISDEMLNYSQRLSFIFIARSIDFIHLLDKSTRSTLMHNVIKFNPYSSKELFDILKARVGEAFYSGVVSDDILMFIAEIAEEAGGDARYAIEILWRASKFAESSLSRKIELEHVRKAVSTIHPLVRIEVLSSLLHHEKLLLLSIARALRSSGKAYVTMGEVEETYRAICEEFNEKPRKHTKLWSYVKNLRNLGLIRAEVKSIEGRGRSTVIGLAEIPIETVEREILKMVLEGKNE
ncbi:MAG: cell division control protein Cdc6, partial [Candidatus Methanomethylicota archaeon]